MPLKRGLAGGIAHNPVHRLAKPQASRPHGVRRFLARALDALGSGHPPHRPPQPQWGPLTALRVPPWTFRKPSTPSSVEVGDVIRGERDTWVKHQQSQFSGHVVGKIKVFRELERNKQYVLLKIRSTGGNRRLGGRRPTSPSIFPHDFLKFRRG